MYIFALLYMINFPAYLISLKDEERLLMYDEYN